MNEELGSCYFNLGNAYLRLSQPQLPLAEECFTKAIDIWEKLETAYETIARAYSNLSFVTMERGRIEEAIQFEEKALLIRKLTSKMKPHPDDADSHHHLALLYLKRGKEEQAQDNYNEAVKIFNLYPEIFGEKIRIANQRLSEFTPKLSDCIDFPKFNKEKQDLYWMIQQLSITFSTIGFIEIRKSLRQIASFQSGNPPNLKSELKDQEEKYKQATGYSEKAQISFDLAEVCLQQIGRASCRERV